MHAESPVPPAPLDGWVRTQRKNKRKRTAESDAEVSVQPSEVSCGVWEAPTRMMTYALTIVGCDDNAEQRRAPPAGAAWSHQKE